MLEFSQTRMASGGEYFSVSLGVRVIDQVGPYPGFALVANTRTLSSKQRNAIRSTLLAASREARDGWGEPMRNGAIIAVDKDYATLRTDQLGLQRRATGGVR